MKLLLLASILVGTLGVTACTDEGAFTDHDEDSDFDDVDGFGEDGKADFAGIPVVFDRNLIMSDEQFTAVDAVDAGELQAFFEESPYANRSWLADYSAADGRSAAELIVDAATAEGINPILLLSRMQVEQSLVSKTVRPSTSRLDKALGCGCPDGSGCSAAYRGFSAQLTCGARILRKWYDASIAGNGIWNLGVAKKTLDPLTVTPRSHATSSFYAYTPWVLQGRGGTWLVWNVTRKYFKHLDAMGVLGPSE
jgi:hypothetical protein